MCHRVRQGQDDCEQEADLGRHVDLSVPLHAGELEETLLPGGQLPHLEKGQEEAELWQEQAMEYEQE